MQQATTATSEETRVPCNEESTSSTTTTTTNNAGEVSSDAPNPSTTGEANASIAPPQEEHAQPVSGAPAVDAASSSRSLSHVWRRRNPPSGGKSTLSREVVQKEIHRLQAHITEQRTCVQTIQTQLASVGPETECVRLSVHAAREEYDTLARDLRALCASPVGSDTPVEVAQLQEAEWELTQYYHELFAFASTCMRRCFEESRVVCTQAALAQVEAQLAVSRLDAEDALQQIKLQVRKAERVVSELEKTLRLDAMHDPSGVGEGSTYTTRKPTSGGEVGRSSVPQPQHGPLTSTTLAASSSAPVRPAQRASIGGFFSSLIKAAVQQTETTCTQREASLTQERTRYHHVLQEVREREEIVQWLMDLFHAHGIREDAIRQELHVPSSVADPSAPNAHAGGRLRLIGRGSLQWLHTVIASVLQHTETLEHEVHALRQSYLTAASPTTQESKEDSMEVEVKTSDAL